MNAMTKVTTLTNLNNTDPVTCGMCLHFKSSAHRGKDDLCSKVGVRAFAPAPKCFTPDMTQIIKSTDTFVQLVSLLGQLTAKQVKILQSYLRTSTPPTGFSVGEEVYFNSRSRDYVCNYRRAFIVGTTSSKEIILIGDPSLKARGKAFFAYLKSDCSLLSAKQWEVKLADLLRRGRIDDPKLQGLPPITQEVKASTYEVPTIDSAPEDPNPKPRRGRKDLVEILTI